MDSGWRVAGCTKISDAFGEVTDTVEVVAVAIGARLKEGRQETLDVLITIVIPIQHQGFQNYPDSKL